MCTYMRGGFTIRLNNSPLITCTNTKQTQAMKTLDEDGDGNIDFDEFKSFMLKANVNSTCEISGE